MDFHVHGFLKQIVTELELEMSIWTGKYINYPPGHHSAAIVVHHNPDQSIILILFICPSFYIPLLFFNILQTNKCRLDVSCLTLDFDAQSRYQCCAFRILSRRCTYWSVSCVYVQGAVGSSANLSTTDGGESWESCKSKYII